MGRRRRRRVSTLFQFPISQITGIFSRLSSIRINTEIFFFFTSTEIILFSACGGQAVSDRTSEVRERRLEEHLKKRRRVEDPDPSGQPRPEVLPPAAQLRQEGQEAAQHPRRRRRRPWTLRPGRQ